MAASKLFIKFNAKEIEPFQAMADQLGVPLKKFCLDSMKVLSRQMLQEIEGIARRERSFEEKMAAPVIETPKLIIPPHAR